MLSLNSLNPQQRDAVQTTDGPLLILAGAGTGKTRVITTRIAYLIHRGVPPANILAVTFTNKAAREMTERVRSFLPRTTPSQSANRPTVCTFHSLCVRILRQHIERLGYKNNFVIYDSAEQLSVIKRLLSQTASAKTAPDPYDILALLSRLKNNGNSPLTTADPATLTAAQSLRDRYQSALLACNAVDFDDLILLTLRLFSDHPDALQACRTRYRYVMVDEYQDTNAAQFQLVHALAAVHRNLCVVGDDDQSIYGWRGAEIANLLDLEKHFPEVKIVKLEQNYRSTTTILNAANAVIRHNSRRRGKNLWSSKGQGQKITLFACPDEETEARTVVEEIEFARIARRIPWSDQAILFRTNQQSRPIETALRKASIRYHLVGGQSFFDRREVRDLLAYLKTILNPQDDISLLRIANVPARGLSDTTMQRLLAASQERQCSVFEAANNPLVQAAFPPRTQHALAAFVQLIQDARSQILHPQNTPSLQAWADSLLDQIDYPAELRRAEKDPESAENRIRTLRDLTASLEAAPNPTTLPIDRLRQFLEDITLDADRDEEPDTPAEAITLITMHSCKGLEFPHVFVVGLEEGLLPHARSKLEGTLDEERRLFYVAITRAMLSLRLSHCASRRRYGQPAPCHPSRFLNELPPDLVESADQRPTTPVSPQEGGDWFAALRAQVG